MKNGRITREDFRFIRQGLMVAQTQIKDVLENKAPSEIVKERVFRLEECAKHIQKAMDLLRAAERITGTNGST